MEKLYRPVACLASLIATCGLAFGADDRETLDVQQIPALYAELNPPPVSGVRVHDVRSTSAVIEWPAGLGGQGPFRVEVRRFDLGADRKLTMRWEEFRSAPIVRRGELFSARLRKLEPRQPYWIRVLALKEGGAPGEPLFAVRFETPAEPRHFTPMRAALGVLLLLLGVIVWLRWRQRAA